jgi:exo-beta-1,3-glucanase (GH17 family)
VRGSDTIDGVIVGNQAVLRGDLSVEQLTGYICRVRQQVMVPVSTAEPWHVWIQHPELVEAVDHITVHPRGQLARPRPPPLRPRTKT